jgi:acyl-CoA synthetase (AMP-forming)/AMP-acid ligase II
MALLLGEIVRRQARHRGERTAYVIGAERVTYGRLNALANRFAHVLRGLGVGRGDRVATLAMNRVEYPALYFAAAKLGAIHVPINFRWKAAEVRYALAQSEAGVLLVAGEFEDMARSLRPDLPALRHVIGLDGEGAGSAAHLVARASDGEPEAAVEERDPHVMLYTSGTTGDPKGALLSHRSYVLQAAQTQGTTGLGEDDVGLCMFPMFHMGGWAMPLGYWANGGCVVLMERADPGEILRLVAGERVTYLYLIPTLFDSVLALPELDSTDLTSLRALGSGTSVMTEAQVRTIVERFRNPNLFVAYGQSEAGPIATLRPRDVVRKATSVGRPVVNVDVALVGADGGRVGPGVVGEIVCRSEFTMLGYWRMPEATAAALRDGWLHTGDLGTFDEEGFLHIAGRAREMIKCGGENIYPAEVERCLLEHPDIAEAAVFSVPDERWGEIVVAAVVPQAGATLGEDEVVGHVRSRLAGYKKPRHVLVLDALPRTASTRQVQKTLLRERWTRAHAAGR